MGKLIQIPRHQLIYLGGGVMLAVPDEDAETPTIILHKPAIQTPIWGGGGRPPSQGTLQPHPADPPECFLEENVVFVV